MSYGQPMSREDVTFTSGGTRCAAWLYRPDAAAGDVPCVVMAHGFTGTRSDRLPAYAERFAAAGLAALVFDYRHFGDSEGEPRQHEDSAGKLADLRDAVGYLGTRPEVDADRIGSSVTVISPAKSCADSNASGIIVSDNIARIAPAAIAIVAAMTSCDAPLKKT